MAIKFGNSVKYLTTLLRFVYNFCELIPIYYNSMYHLNYYNIYFVIIHARYQILAFR